MSGRGRHAPGLTEEDKTLIADCKAERKRLKRQLSQLTDRALAKKFGVSNVTIERIPEAD